MPQNGERRYLFEVFESREGEEGPWYIFLERRPAEGEPAFVDTPLYIRLPPEGAFWTKYLYPDDEIHGSQPTDLFEKELGAVMDDPSWRMAVNSDAESSPTLQTEISERVLDNLPAHEAPLLRTIQATITEERELPEGIQTYLLGLT